MTQPHDAPEPVDPTGPGGTGVPNEAEPADVPVEESGDDPVEVVDRLDEPVDELADARRQLEERTADLQRLQAEYVNYKRRVERDRELIKQNATYAALAPIVEVLDTIDRARESARSMDSELDPGLRAVAEQLERTVAGSGLVKFGAVGEPFDPMLHEALVHQGEDPDVTVTTIAVVAKSGYKIGERVVRAAQVLVVDPPA